MRKSFKELPEKILGADVVVKFDVAHWIFGPLRVSAGPAEDFQETSNGFVPPKNGWIVGYHFRDHPSVFRAAKDHLEVEQIVLEYVSTARMSLECEIAVANSNLLAFDALTTPTVRRRKRHEP